MIKTLVRTNKFRTNFLRCRFFSSLNIEKNSFKDVELIRFTRGKNSCHNIPIHIENRIGAKLHLKKNHPINIISKFISSYFETSYISSHNKKLSLLNPPLSKKLELSVWEDLSPIVTVENNFDKLLIPFDHVSRSPSDTYYLSETQLLRCHTSAHQNELMSRKNPLTLIVGDVYRRDSIDTTHYPIFHQMEGIRIFESHPSIDKDFALQDLKETLENLIFNLFGKVETRWVDAAFPFTNPSIELEVYFNNSWLEILGCGLVQDQILRNTGNENKVAWAFGLGLERLAMILFNIEDIRLFWSQDHRFSSQFEEGKIVKFKTFSKQPACYKDITFWVNTSFCESEFYEIVRDIGGDFVEEVKLIDRYQHPETHKVSFCYRINYRAMDRTLFNSEIDEVQQKLRNTLLQKLDIQLR